MTEIQQWNDIKDRFTHGLLLGNGASVAVHRGFAYPSLYEAAQANGHLNDHVAGVFDAFGVTDFELVLRRLWQAKVVNEKLGIEAGRVEESYALVRNALISTVHDVHISHEEARPHLEPIFGFMSGFETVVSLNYDLLVYWAVMQSKDQFGGQFKDCFLNGEFVDEWEEWRRPWNADRTTLVFYPHGSLALVRGLDDQERKLAARANQDLLSRIVEVWESGKRVPLFVCEGTAEQKMRSIGGSAYLQRVYSEVLPVVGESLVIYGWGMGEQEKHILQRLKHAKCKRVAVSVYERNPETVRNAEHRLQEVGIEEVVFFDSASPGCWNNPADV